MSLLLWIQILISANIVGLVTVFERLANSSIILPRPRQIVDEHIIDGQIVDGHNVEGHIVDGHIVDGHIVDGQIIDGHFVDIDRWPFPRWSMKYMGTLNALVCI